MPHLRPHDRRRLEPPFGEDGSLDLASLASNLLWLLDRGADETNTVLLAAGSCGDFTSMSLAERQDVIRIAAELNQRRIPLIAGVQSLDVRECIALCQFCEQLGVDAVQIQVERFVDESAAALGGVDLLVANVGGSSGKGFLASTPEEWTGRST